MINLGTKYLETDRLILRKFEKNDLEQIYNNWLSDDKMTTFLGWKAHDSVEESKRILNIWLNNYNDNNYNWNIILKETNESVGNISIINSAEMSETNNAYIYYCLGSKFWKNGYAKEALKRVIEFLINEVEIDMISAGHDELNEASGKVLIGVGMEFVNKVPNMGYNPKTKQYDTNRLEYRLKK